LQIKAQNIAVKEIVNQYQNNYEEGVTGYNGKLNIRPAYQREFVYKDKQRDAVINTVMSGLPLSMIYWADNKDGTYGLLDGQQRTLSLCQYVNGDFAIDYKYFHNLTEEEKESILNYELMVYVCSGTDKEQLDWFTTINIAGEKLTNQELRNSIYTGAWLTDAKKAFSKTGCKAYEQGSNYLTD